MIIIIDTTKYKDLTITNDFMFANVFTDTEISRELIEVIFNKPVGNMTFLDSQKTFKSNQNSKGTRLDVIMNDSNSYYNFEMQNRKFKNLSKRRIYYKSNIITHLLKQGQDYEELPKVNVIFICNFDYFGKGECVYTFDNCCCENRNLILEDSGIDVFINIKGYKNANTPAQSNLFKYFCTGISTDKFTRKIDKLVKKLTKPNCLGVII